MSSPRLDDDSFSVEFSSELLAAFDFGGFELTGGSLISFGSYENEYDDASFSFSVESYVGVRNRNCRSCSRHFSVDVEPNTYSLTPTIALVSRFPLPPTVR